MERDSVFNNHFKIYKNYLNDMRKNAKRKTKLWHCNDTKDFLRRFLRSEISFWVNENWFLRSVGKNYVILLFYEVPQLSKAFSNKFLPVGILKTIL